MQIVSKPIESFFVEKDVSRGNMAVTHYHNAYEMYYLLHGESDYFIADSFYKVVEHDVVLIPTSVLHRTAGKTSSRILVHFTDEFLSRFIKPSLLSPLSLDSPLVFRPSPEVDHSIMHDFEQLNSLYQACVGDESDEAILAGVLFKILFSVSKERNQYENREYDDARIEKIIRYINENYATIDGLDSISKHFFISKYHFCRMFRKNLGVSVTAYLNTIKVRAACQLLSSKDYTLTDITTKCGFNSVSYFCKVFKGEMGISPSLYRKRSI